MEYIKRAPTPPDESDIQIRQTVETILTDIEQNGEAAVLQYASELDNWDGDVILSKEKRSELIKEVPNQICQDIKFAYKQIKTFAEAQRNSLQEFEIETEPGVSLGQRIIPVSCAGCYVPGGRYAHIASALMSITTAKVAGVPLVITCSPPTKNAIDYVGGVAAGTTARIRLGHNITGTENQVTW